MLICGKCLGKSLIEDKECDRCEGQGYRYVGQCLDNGCQDEREESIRS